MSNKLYLGYDSRRGSRFTPYTSQPEALARMMCGESVFLSGVSGAGKFFVVNKFVEVMQEHFLSEGVSFQKKFQKQLLLPVLLVWHLQILAG